MTFIFDGDVAEIVGANAAVIFWNLKFWIAKNKANDKNYHDGRYWTYNSKKAFQELFPFLSEQGIKTALNKLIEADLITTGDYNAKKFDRTLWYALTEKGERIGENQPTHNGEIQPLHRGNSTFPSVENNRPIPDINTGIKPNKFIVPTVQDVSTYCKENGYNVDAQRFVDFYQSKGWLVGKSKMKDWRAAVRNWARRDKAETEVNTSSAWLQEAIDRYKEKERT